METTKQNRAAARIAAVVIAGAAAMVCICAFTACQKKAADGKATLRFAWWGGDERHQATLKAIALYEERNPGIKVEAEYGGFDGYQDKLVTQIAGGTAADIIQIDQPWLHSLSARADVFLTLEASAALDISAFDDAFLQNYCSYNNKIKGLPTGLNGETFLQDNAILTQAGIDPSIEWTWDTLLSEGRKINAGNSKKYAWGCSPEQTSTTIFQKYITQLAGGLIDADKNIMWTDAQAEEALTYITKLIDNKVISPFNESSLYNKKDEENPEWVNGNLALIQCWVSNQDKQLAGRALTVSALPVRAQYSNSGILVRPSQILVVNNNSKYKDEAVEFLNFFFNDVDAVKTLATTRGIPATSTGRELLAAQGLIKPLMEQGIETALAKGGKPQTAWDMNTEIQDLFREAVEKAGFKQKTPAQSAAELRAAVSAKLTAL
ncbi:MAG: extracellular solute-binding protein [Spirochaetaceae bacterium]|jgi:oligogalacturonide transport system substrate-binding protein|nr:extracellular solute-binding protein [Spirochaetaceae bacterium]